MITESPRRPVGFNLVTLDFAERLLMDQAELVKIADLLLERKQIQSVYSDSSPRRHFRCDRLASFQTASGREGDAAMTTLEPWPTPGMSYLAEGDIAWERQTPASRRKILRLDEELYVAIVQWDAGFELPGLDEHGGEEIVYVLQGTFTDQYRSSGPGTVIRGEAGSSHRPRTPDGVTFMVVRSLAPGERDRIAGLRLSGLSPHFRTSGSGFWSWAGTVRLDDLEDEVLEFGD